MVIWGGVKRDCLVALLGFDPWCVLLFTSSMLYTLYLVCNWGKEVNTVSV